MGYQNHPQSLSKMWDNDCQVSIACTYMHKMCWNIQEQVPHHDDAWPWWKCHFHFQNKAHISCKMTDSHPWETSLYNLSRCSPEPRRWGQNSKCSASIMAVKSHIKMFQLVCRISLQTNLMASKLGCPENATTNKMWSTLLCYTW
jgi:hypothetical protein